MAEADVDLSAEFVPFRHQLAWHDLRERVRFLVLVCHRRGGKTVFAVMELILAALSDKTESGRYGYIAPFLGQAKAAAWDYLRQYTASIPGCAYNQSELSVTFPNGARIRLFGADNADALRGMYFDGVVLDEVADMKPGVWDQAVRPMLSDRQGWAIFIGTPKGENLFSELYHAALEQKPGWEEWAADLRRASDTGVLAEEEVEKARNTMGPAQFAQEYECDFASSADNILITSSDVREAQERVFHQVEYAYAAKLIGVDVARFGDDRTVFFRRQGRATFEPKVYRSQDTVQVAALVAQEIEDWKPDAVFVDEIGVGAGVVDQLRSHGFKVHAVNSATTKVADARYFNLRAQMWGLMVEWVRAGGRLPGGHELLKELTTPTYKIRPDGKIQLEAKEDLKKRGFNSPDLADALALTFAFPIAPPPTQQSHHLQRYTPGKAVTRLSQQGGR